MIRQTILPFKVEMTGDMITPHAGLALMGEFAVGLKLLKSVPINRDLPKPKRDAGYKPSEYIFPVILMLNGGGRTLEDTRQIKDDEGLREVFPLKRIPSTDAIGDWLRRIRQNGLAFEDEFREGNDAPAARNLEFIKHCERQMPNGH